MATLLYQNIRLGNYFNSTYFESWEHNLTTNGDNALRLYFYMEYFYRSSNFCVTDCYYENITMPAVEHRIVTLTTKNCMLFQMFGLKFDSIDPKIYVSVFRSEEIIFLY